MGTFIDYLEWRGDLPFEIVPFCEVDAMILSGLIYIDMKGLADESFEFGDCSCYSVCHRHITTQKPADSVEKNIYSIAESVCSAPRFANIKICGYKDIIDPGKQQQFAAATFMLEEGLYFIAFRGTDFTIVGWRENMALAYNEEVPSQKSAVAYLNEAVQSLKGDFIVGGHSKGGNLAVYATACSFKKNSKHVKSVYNFDGPGFNDMVLAKKNFHDIFDKVHTFVPQNSLIGMLLKHEEPYTVIKSTKSSGITQHQINSWMVGPTAIEQVNDLTGSTKFVNESISEWIDSMTYEEKEQFIDIIFGLADDLDTVDDLFSVKNLRMIMKEYSALDDESKKKVSGVLDSLQESVVGTIKNRFKDLW